MKYKILFAVAYLIILSALASIAHELKGLINKKPEPKSEIIIVPKTDNTHRNLACRIQRNHRFNKIS